jgi:hypothetical protein
MPANKSYPAEYDIGYCGSLPSWIMGKFYAFALKRKPGLSG